MHGDKIGQVASHLHILFLQELTLEAANVLQNKTFSSHIQILEKGRANDEYYLTLVNKEFAGYKTTTGENAVYAKHHFYHRDNIIVSNFHFERPNTYTKEEKPKAVKKIFESLELVPDQPFIGGGDFNMDMIVNMHDDVLNKGICFDQCESETTDAKKKKSKYDFVCFSAKHFEEKATRVFRFDTKQTQDHFLKVSILNRKDDQVRNIVEKVYKMDEESINKVNCFNASLSESVNAEDQSFGVTGDSQTFGTDTCNDSKDSDNSIIQTQEDEVVGNQLQAILGRLAHLEAFKQRVESAAKSVIADE